MPKKIAEKMTKEFTEALQENIPKMQKNMPYQLQKRPKKPSMKLLNKIPKNFRRNINKKRELRISHMPKDISKELPDPFWNFNINY